eukprot:scaffold37018_cov24-Tisochrysis_lutea.AAC.1
MKHDGGYAVACCSRGGHQGGPIGCVGGWCCRVLQMLHSREGSIEYKELLGSRGFVLRNRPLLRMVRLRSLGRNTTRERMRCVLVCR